MQVIDSFRGKYGWLSNFHQFDNLIECNGFYFRTVENAYQSAKSLNSNVRRIFTTLTPSEAKQLGKEIKIRPDWDLVKLKIMEDLVLQKFTKNEQLRKKLVDTGETLLIEENTWGDQFWGICNGKGENHLGKILMKIRESLI